MTSVNIADEISRYLAAPRVLTTWILSYIMYCMLYVVFTWNVSYISLLSCALSAMTKLRWRHNERDGVSIHQPQRLFTQPFIQAQIKENIKVPRHWPFCVEFTGHRWIPHTKGQQRGWCCHLMTSSWRGSYGTKGRCCVRETAFSTTITNHILTNVPMIHS